jgi:hypothetical protein
MSQKKGGISLKRLLDLLLEEGASEDEAEEIIEGFIARRRGAMADPQNPLARVGHGAIDPAHTPTLGPGQRPVDYGNETAAEAKERWMRQEMSDPQGVFAGGSSAGGIFGDGAIATDSYDPGAVRRTVDLRNQAQQAEVQHRTLSVLERVMERLEGGSDNNGPRIGHQGPDPRQLGRRRK